MRLLRGSPASSGVARGPWLRVVAEPAPSGGRIAAEAAEAELARLAGAAERAAMDLEALAASVAAGGHPDEAAIFSAQATMARDPALAESAAARIRDGEDAVGAVVGAGREFADQLRALGEEVFVARAADVEDVSGRIAGLLAGRASAGPALERPSIVVAEDLPPSVTATLARERLLGIALEGGSPTAHAAILARAYGIPAVVGAAGLLAALGNGDPRAELAIDGSTGEIVLAPDAPTRARFERRRAETEGDEARALAEAGLPATTRDGVEVRLLANIGTPAESQRCVALGARGVGLFRTEFLFLERTASPGEEEQLAAYGAVVAAFAPGPVTIRLLDVGGDKPIPYLPIAPEANPFLGVRALRLAPRQPEIFVTQLRAAMRAAAVPGAGPVKVMAPMVADALDVDLLLELSDRARRELHAASIPHGEIELGVMLEIPSAILVAGSYFGRLRFASIGTNDLLQYALAVDRGNRELGRYQDPLHPALLRLVRDAVAAAGRAGIELSVCGEMAGDPVAALALVGLGIRDLSMASSSLAPVRRAIRAVERTVLEAEVSEALDAASAAEVRARFAALAPGRD